MVSFNWKKIKEFEKEWWRRHDSVMLPRFIATGWRKRRDEMLSNQRDTAFSHELIEMSRDEYEAYVLGEPPVRKAIAAK